MTPEQKINNLRRQAAEALKIGNFDLMTQFDQMATSEKSDRHETLFLQMRSETAKLAPKTATVSAAVVNQQPTRRVFRVNR
jgi:hypothetical protein